jgi:hypothetical protein
MKNSIKIGKKSRKKGGDGAHTQGANSFCRQVKR